MAAIIRVVPLRWYQRLGDLLMTPIMYLFSGTLWEKPQQTHRWNRQVVSFADRKELNQAQCCSAAPDWRACPRGSSLRFHLPLLGGWRHYVVLEPSGAEEWHVGWAILYTKESGLSRIRLSGPVRMLLGPELVNFFAIRASDSKQVPLKVIAVGRVGDRGPFCRAPLL